MRTQGEVEGLTLTSEKAFADLEMRIMEDVVERIKVNGASTATADWEISRLAQLGISERNIHKWVAEALGVGQKEADRILSDEVYEDYNKHARAYKLSGLKQTPFAENAELQNLIRAVTQQTHGTFENITRSLGFATKGPLGKINVQQLQQFYTQTLDNAMMDIVSGAFSYNSVLERTIDTMTRSGLRSVDYATGHSNRIEVAVRRALMTGYSQIQRYNAEQVADELGTDYFEVSAHGGARPSHAEWQGRVYSRAELYSVCGLDTATGLLGINCYHSYDPFIPGVSIRRYSDDDLDQIRREDNRPREYGGKTYNKYEALQHQRKLETTLRKYRRDAYLLEKGGADPDTILNKKIKYQVTYSKYKSFSQAMELPMQRARIYQDGLKVSTYVRKSKRPFKMPAYLSEVKNAEAFEGDLVQYFKREMKHIPEKHWKELHDYVKEVRIDAKGPSRYNRDTKVIYLKGSAGRGDLTHEIGHALETKLKLYDREDYQAVRNQGLPDKISVFSKDVVEETREGGRTIRILKNDKFVSDYQGYINPADQYGGKDFPNGYLNKRTLIEYFSEGYRFYCVYPEILKQKDRTLYDYIRRLL